MQDIPGGGGDYKRSGELPVSKVATIPASGVRVGASHPTRRFGEKESNTFSIASFRLIVVTDNLASSLKPKWLPSVRTTVLLSSSSLKEDTWRVGLNGAKSSIVTKRTESSHNRHLNLPDGEQTSKRKIMLYVFLLYCARFVESSLEQGLLVCCLLTSSFGAL